MSPYDAIESELKGVDVGAVVFISGRGQLERTLAVHRLYRQGYFDCVESGVFKRTSKGKPAPAVRDSDIEKMLDLQAVHDVLAERCRQVERYGHTPMRDDVYTKGELIWASMAYVNAALDVEHLGVACSLWPWDPRSFHPANRRSNLVKATALALAEIERYDRAEAACKSKTASSTVDRFNSSSPSYPLARR